MMTIDKIIATSKDMVIDHMRLRSISRLMNSSNVSLLFFPMLQIFYTNCGGDCYGKMVSNQ